MVLRGKTINVHAIVAAAFLGPRPGRHDINHKDGDKCNNRVENLEYCTRSENVRHAIRLGLAHLPHVGKKLSDEDRAEIVRRRTSGASLKESAAGFPINSNSVYLIVKTHMKKERPLLSILKGLP